MCGIVGLVQHDGQSPAPATLETMLAQLISRGPDDRGVYFNGRIGLGHTRLSILDLSSRGQQPFRTTDGTGVLSFNGEIYNYLELRAELQQAGVKFVSNTDTEVLLYALHTWGVEATVPRLNGMFAFAYADLRTNTVWLTRDRMGIKPLFIAETPDGIAFASEQKALLAHPQINAVPNNSHLLSLLLYERFDNEQTCYTQIQSFIPGRILKLQQDHQQWQTYFDPQTCLSKLNDPQFASSGPQFTESLSTFDRALQASVESQLMSDAPVAALCSGGLDSSLITTLATRHTRNIACYVADMQGMQSEELRRAGIVAAAVGAELHPVAVGQKEFLQALPHAIAANDQPLFFAQQVAAMLIAKQLRQDGFKVVLTGSGADEIFGGYTWHHSEYQKWLWLSRRAKWLPDLPVLHKVSRILPHLKPVDLDREVANFALAGQRYDYVSTTLNVQIVAGMQRTLRQRRLFQQLNRLPLAERAFLTSNLEDVYVHMRESLNSLDKMTMRYGIEARVPFLDNHIIDLGMALPVNQKLHKGKRKALINQLAGKYLPHELINLPKIGFTAPAQMWRPASKLLARGHVADLLKWPDSSFSEIEQLLQRQPYFLFRLLGLEIWLQLQLEQRCPDEIGERLCAISDK